MPTFKIQHITQYEYDRPVKESVNEIKIFPYQCPEQETLQHELIITEQPELHYYNDYWNNRTAIFNVLPAHKVLTIDSRLIIRTTGTNQLRVNFNTGFADLQHEVNAQLNLQELDKADSIKNQQQINQIAQLIALPAKSIAAITETCCEYIFKNFKYTKGITTTETTVDEILEHQGGVCQDFAHVMLQVLRSLQIPSRYVSGYICPNQNGMRGEGATHAWVEAWIPQYGWAGIDPTNNVWITNNHIKLAVGRNFNDCSPVKGTFKGPAKQNLSVYVSVGYEDGHIFEERTSVKMEIQEPTKEEIAAIDTFAGQQQQ
jgi:transglutaminase-like putative cysteine protease